MHFVCHPEFYSATHMAREIISVVKFYVQILSFSLGVVSIVVFAFHGF